MSPVSFRRFIVKAFDYEELTIVVQATSSADAIRKAEAIYNADAFSITKGVDLGWTAQLLATEVSR